MIFVKSGNNSRQYSNFCSLLVLFPLGCNQRGLKNVFDEAILAALEPPETKTKRKCVLL